MYVAYLFMFTYRNGTGLSAKIFSALSPTGLEKVPHIAILALDHAFLFIVKLISLQSIKLYMQKI